MKDWIKIRKSLKEIFEDDYIHYYKDEKYFEIVANTFINDELLELCVLCEEHRLWFYLDVSNKRNIIIKIVEK